MKIVFIECSIGYLKNILKLQQYLIKQDKK